MHVPFCRSRCLYCDFYSCVIEDSSGTDLYLDALTKNHGTCLDPGSAPTIYIGGGTPTVLPIPAFTRMLELVAPWLAVDGEWTVEANPESLDEERCQLLAESGVTRLSLGIQSLRNQDLRFLGRAHDPGRARQALDLAIKTGFAGVSADLLLGLPGQTKADVSSLLDEFAGRGVNHVSFYMLTLEEGTPLTRLVGEGQLEIPGSQRQAELFLFCRQCLRELGFEPYEISNAALPGKECQHNLRYWLGGDYLGLGPAASSLIKGHRTTNIADFVAWVEAVENGKSPYSMDECLPPARAAGERAWLMLRTMHGLDLARVQTLTTCNDDWVTKATRQIEEFIGQGLIAHQDGRFHLTENGFLQADAIGAAFIQPPNLDYPLPGGPGCG